MCAICGCSGLGFSCWISAGGRVELPTMQWRSFKPTDATCFLVPSSFSSLFYVEIPNPFQSVQLKMCPNGNVKIHSAKSRKENQKSYFKLWGIPKCLVASNCIHPFISSSEWVSAIGQKIHHKAEHLLSHIASGWQQEWSSSIGGRRKQRMRDGEKKKKRQQQHSDRSPQRLLSPWLHSLKCTALYWLAPSLVSHG